MKWLKRILLTLGILIVLLLAAAVLIPILFKDKIEAAVKVEVNKNLNATVNWGEWNITIFKSFPDLTVEINDVSVLNVAPFEGIELARIGQLVATVDIKSLFGDRIDIKRVGLEKPRIHVKVLEDGRANWDIAKADTVAAETPADTAASQFNIGLREYWITDARVIYEDASLPYSMNLFGLDHQGTGDFTQDLFTLKTTTQADTVNVVFDGVQYLRNVKLDLKADLDMDMPNMKFTFKENELAVNELVLGFDGYVAMPGDPIEMDITWNAKKTDFGTLLSLVPAAFASDLKGVQMSGKAGFSGFVKGTQSETSMPGFGLVLDVDNGRFKYPDLPAAVEDIFVDLKVTSPGGKDLDGTIVDLKRFAMKMAGNPVDARLYLTTPISDPNVDAELKANLDLASVKQVVPMPGEDLSGRITADVRMKGAMSAIEAQRYEQFQADGKLILLGMKYSTDSLPYDIDINSLYFDFSPRFLSLTSFDGNLGSSSIQAKGRLDNYIAWWLRDSTLIGSFDMAANRFDLNELMGPSAPETASADAPADSSSLSVIEVPGNIDFRMGLTVKEVVFDQLNLTNVRGGMRIHDQRVDLKDVFFNLFGGSVNLAGGYAAKDATGADIDLRYDVRDLDIQQTVTYVDLVQKVAPIAKTCKGVFSTKLDMKARLNEKMDADVNTLAGEGTLVTRNVQVDGFQPLVEIAKALKVKELENTRIQDVSFSYEFKDGRMVVKPFKVKIDRVQSEIHGSTGFANQDIDYDMKAKIPTDLFGSGAAQAVGGLLGKASSAIGSDFQVPKELDATIKVTGTITKPVVKPVFAGGTTSVKDAVVTEIKQTVNEEIGKKKEELIAQAKAERDRLVAEAQKQADQMKADARREAANAKAQAYKAADDQVAQVTNPLARAAAKLAADKAKQEAEKVEQRAVAEADKKADGLVDAARKKGDDLVKKAEETDTTVK